MSGCTRASTGCGCADADTYRRQRTRILGERPSFNNPQWRSGYILATLFRSLVPVRSDELAQAMLVGRTTVVADLADLRRSLERHLVTIEGRSGVGLWLEGTEPDQRLAVLRLGFEQAYGEYEPGPEVDAGFDKVMAEHKVDPSVARTVRRWLVICLDRFFAGHPLAELPAVYGELRGTPAHRTATALADELAPVIADRLPEAEVLFLAVPLASMRSTSFFEHGFGSVDVTAEKLVNQIFERITTQLDLRIDPSALVTEFTHHVAFMLNRLRYSLSNGEPGAADQLAAAYPLAHRMSTVAAEVIAEQTGLVMDESEIGLTSAYFQVFLEEHSSRRARPLRVGIVTGRGPGIAELIRSQLVRTLPAGTELSVVASPQQIPDGLDVLVATPGSEPHSPLPVIVVSEVFDRDELIRRLTDLTLTGRGSLTLARPPSSLLVALLDEDRFISLPAGCSYQEATQILVEHLVARGLVTPEFVALLAERERQSTMLLTESVGFPHASAPDVDHLVCAMGVIPKADAEEGIRMVFLMAAPEKSSYDDNLLIGAYDELIRLSTDRGLLNRTSRLSSYEQLFYLMESAFQTENQ